MPDFRLVVALIITLAVVAYYILKLKSEINGN